MKILVPVKRVVDYEAKIRIRSDGSGIETEGIKWIVNPFDEIAVEEAVRLKEAGAASEVVVVGIGGEDTVPQLRYAMAMGADSAILAQTDEIVDSDLASKVLAAVWKKGDYQLLLMGKQAIDSDASQTPQLTAERLQLPHASFASKIEAQEGQFVVTREIDGGLEMLRIQRPCVISTDLRLNEPRYAPLPGIMKAKKKPLETFSLADLGVSGAARVIIKKMVPPPVRSAGRKVADVDELVKALKEEARVL